MTNEPDQLFECLEYHLTQAEMSYKSEDEFVHKVVFDYCHRLLEKGFICEKHLQEIGDDLMDEVRTMLRKVMYGHFNLNEYLQFRQKNKGS